MSVQTKTSRQMALEINLDDRFYGIFAEIGAGQEVARHFFKAGAASGSIAKTICAYDMTYSDIIYGKEESGRYVCEARLMRMLDREYNQLTERLIDQAARRCFFAYANTVAIRNFHGTNEAHGWMGVRFQHQQQETSSDVVIHIRLFDLSPEHQQDVIGIVGVNLMYAAFYERNNPEQFVKILMSGLDKNRIEIDMIKINGKAFDHFDNRLVDLELVKQGITNAILFAPDGKIVPVNEYFYKKNILVARGSYHPPTLVNLDVFKSSVKSFGQKNNLKESEITTVAELTLTALKQDSDFTSEDFLARVDLLKAMGIPVLVSNYQQYYKLSSFLARFKAKSVAIVLGVYNFLQIFDEKYNDAQGGLLESLGLLFRNNTQVFVYPSQDEDSGKIIDLKSMDVDKKLRHLYQHFVVNQHIIDIENYDPTILHIYSRKVLNMIQNGESGWEAMVPDSVAKTINDKCLFGHPCPTGKK
jgi:hypothetical protein